MLNVKQGSFECQLFHSFGLTRPGNRIQVNRLRGGRFNHYTIQAPATATQRSVDYEASLTKF